MFKLQVHHYLCKYSPSTVKSFRSFNLFPSLSLSQVASSPVIALCPRISVNPGAVIISHHFVINWSGSFTSFYYYPGHNQSMSFVSFLSFPLGHSGKKYRNYCLSFTSARSRCYQMTVHCIVIRNTRITSTASAGHPLAQRQTMGKIFRTTPATANTSSSSPSLGGPSSHHINWGSVCAGGWPNNCTEAGRAVVLLLNEPWYGFQVVSSAIHPPHRFVRSILQS